MYSNYKTKFEKILRENGHHITSAREVIFDTLSAAQEPLSISQIISRTSKKIERVSVYRNIELFERLGIAIRINAGWRHRVELSDVFTGHHHHLTCLMCGRMFDFTSEEKIEQIIREASDAIGFVPRDHQFEIDGHCKACAAKNNT